MLTRVPEGSRTQVIVDIADLQVSDDPNVVFVTYALGSCIAVIVHDPVHKAGGLLHYRLPLSRTNRELAESNPAAFADTGIPLLFEQMYRLGSKKKDLVVKVVGGAKRHSGSGPLDIGKQNYVVLRKIFWKNDVLIEAEQVGGSRPRTVRLDIRSGETIVSSLGEETEL